MRIDLTNYPYEIVVLVYLARLEKRSDVCACVFLFIQIHFFSFKIVSWFVILSRAQSYEKLQRTFNNIVSKTLTSWRLWSQLHLTVPVLCTRRRLWDAPLNCFVLSASSFFLFFNFFYVTPASFVSKALNDEKGKRNEDDSRGLRVVSLFFETI